MTRVLPAALAFACVCSPAVAGATRTFQAEGVAFAPAATFGHGLLVLGLGCLMLSLLLLGVFRFAGLLRRIGATAVFVVAFIVIGRHAALAQEVASPHVDLPWGDWITAALQPAAAILVPIAAAAITAGVAKVSPWAALVLSRQRVQSAVQAGADYGINAVAGAVKGKTLTVPVGSAVIAEGVQHVVNTTPAKVVTKAGGAAGIAGMIFRSLPLDENASVQTVLKPALDDLAQRGLIK